MTDALHPSRMGAVLDSLLARKKFYSSLGGENKGDLDAFARAVTALVFGYNIGASVTIEDETPNDVDGIVLKVTIT